MPQLFDTGPDPFQQPAETPDIRDTKLNSLAKAKEAKLTNLANIKGYDTSVSPQQNLSNAVDTQIYYDKPVPYQIDYMLDGNGISQGTREVPYEDYNKYGKRDTRDLYIDNTAQDNMKLGLARTDQGGYAGRYDTSLHPDWQTASNKQLAGPEGVTTEDGSLMNITLPYNYATKFEHGVHTNPEQIRNRSIGLGPKTDETQQRFGSGQTEYTTQNAPMWNYDYVSQNEDVSNAQPVGDMKLHDVYRKIQGEGYTSPEDLQAQLDVLSNPQGEKGFFNSLLRAPKAALAGLGMSVYDTVDMNVELAGDVAGRVVGLVDEETGKTIDKYVDTGTEKQKKERVNSAIAYDSSFSESIMKASGEHVDKATEEVELFNPSTWSNLKGEELFEAAKVAFSTPETAAYSLGYIVPFMAGATEKAVVKMFGGAIKSHADDVAKIVANKTATSAEKKLAVREAEKALKPADRVKLFVAKNSDAMLMGANLNNNDMDEWITNNGGEDPSLLRMGVGWVLESVGAKIDMSSAKFAIKDSGDLAKVVGDKLRGLGESTSTKVMAKAMEYTARLAAAGVTELPQEFSQTFIQEFNKLYGTQKATDFDGGARTVGFTEALLDPEVRSEALKASIAGSVGGVHMALGGMAISEPSNILTGIKERRDISFDPDRTAAQTFNDNQKSSIYYASPEQFDSIVTPEAQSNAVKVIMDITNKYVTDPEYYFQQGEYTENRKPISKMVTDNIDKIAKIKKIESPELRAYIVADMLVKLNEGFHKVAAKAGNKGPIDPKNFEAFLAPLKAEFSAMPTSKNVEIARKKIVELGLDNILKSMPTLTSALANKKVAGFKLNDKMREELAQGKEAARLLGSEGITGNDNTIIDMVNGIEKEFDRIEQGGDIMSVESQIFNTGFVIGNKHMRSMSQHKDAILEEMISPNNSNALNKLFGFATTRTYDKKIKDFVLAPDDTKIEFENAQKRSLAKTVFHNNTRMLETVYELIGITEQNTKLESYPKTLESLTKTRDTLLQANEGITEKYTSELDGTIDGLMEPLSSIEVSEADAFERQVERANPTESVLDEEFDYSNVDTDNIQFDESSFDGQTPNANVEPQINQSTDYAEVSTGEPISQGTSESRATPEAIKVDDYIVEPTESNVVGDHTVEPVVEEAKPTEPIVGDKDSTLKAYHLPVQVDSKDLTTKNYSKESIGIIEDRISQVESALKYIEEKGNIKGKAANDFRNKLKDLKKEYLLYTNKETKPLMVEYHKVNKHLVTYEDKITSLKGQFPKSYVAIQKLFDSHLKKTKEIKDGIAEAKEDLKAGKLSKMLKEGLDGLRALIEVLNTELKKYTAYALKTKKNRLEFLKVADKFDGTVTKDSKEQYVKDYEAILKLETSLKHSDTIKAKAEVKADILSKEIEEIRNPISAEDLGLGERSIKVLGILKNKISAEKYTEVLKKLKEFVEMECK